MEIPEILSSLTRIPLKSSEGVYECDGEVHRARAIWTPLGVCEAEAAEDVDGENGSVVADAASSNSAQSRIPARLRPLFRMGGEAAKKARNGGVTVGLRANAVTFLSEIVPDDQDVVAGPAADRDDKKDKKATKTDGAHTVLSDTMTVSVGKTKLSLTGKVRMAELDEIREATGFDPGDPHRYEPAPWAAWRSSAYYAPFKPGKGIHLRYMLGASSGLAIVGTSKWPLAWQLLSWDEGDKDEAILQAFHLLSVHAVRRLGLAGIDHVSVQGDDSLDKGWEEAEQLMGHSVPAVDGPEYSPDLVAFGLALGGLEGRTETLNLARSLQEKPSIMSMIPWGEAGFLLSLFLCMLLVLRDHAATLEGQLNKSRAENDAVVWAQGVTHAKLKSESAALAKVVTPLQKYVKRELHFSKAMAAVAAALPDKTWLVNVAGEDLVWEKNPNKALGQRYILMQAGAPSAVRGMTPPEINYAVRALEKSPYLGKVLSRVKLTEVNWRQQGGEGYTVFSVLALPKE